MTFHVYFQHLIHVTYEVPTTNHLNLLTKHILWLFGAQAAGWSYARQRFFARATTVYYN